MSIRQGRFDVDCAAFGSFSIIHLNAYQTLSIKFFCLCFYLARNGSPIEFSPLSLRTSISFNTDSSIRTRKLSSRRFHAYCWHTMENYMCTACWCFSLSKSSSLSTITASSRCSSPPICERIIAMIFLSSNSSFKPKCKGEG